ncbi:MAG: iron transporter [Halodesulfurarchaeum sp.]
MQQPILTRRRAVLRAAGSASMVGLTGLAGCSGLIETRPVRSPPVPEDRPDAVYYPSHYEGMRVVDVQTDGRIACALTYTYPHRFWLVELGGVQRVSIRPEDSVHLMPLLWDRPSGTILPDLAPTVSVSRKGASVEQFSPWPMLSQQMGLHFGDNLHLPAEGTYRVTVDIGVPSIRRTGTLAGQPGDRSFTFAFRFSQSTLESISYTDIPAGKQGTRGAVDPMEHDQLPALSLPDAGTLPGTSRGTGTSGDARFVVTTLRDATRFGGAQNARYLAVSPRTPYNRYPLAMMSLSGTLSSGGQTVFDGPLRATLDPELGYHYGAPVDGIETGDSLRLTIDAPPQLARHEGYETAFVDMPAVTIPLE